MQCSVDCITSLRLPALASCSSATSYTVQPGLSHHPTVQAKAVVETRWSLEPGPIHSWHIGLCTIVHDCTSMYSYWQVWSIEYFLQQSTPHSTACSATCTVPGHFCWLHAHESERTSTLLLSNLTAKMALLVAVCRSNVALGTLKVGRWSHKAGGRCIQCSLCVELSSVHGKPVVRSRWSLNTEVAYTRFYCSCVCTYTRGMLCMHSEMYFLETPCRRTHPPEMAVRRL